MNSPPASATVMPAEADRVAATLRSLEERLEELEAQVREVQRDEDEEKKRRPGFWEARMSVGKKWVVATGYVLLIKYVKGWLVVLWERKLRTAFVLGMLRLFMWHSLLTRRTRRVGTRLQEAFIDWKRRA